MPRAIGDFLILRAIRESGGTAVAVSDDEMVDDMLVMGRHEGVSRRARRRRGAERRAKARRRRIDQKHETVVLFNTGGALKYLDVLR